MVGVKGRSGRPRKYPSNPDDPLRDRLRRQQLDFYYKHREKALAQRRRYHKRIKGYSIKHGISFEEARKIVGNLKKKKGVKT